MAGACAALGPVTLLVNNASLFEADAACAFDARLFDQHMAVNLRAPLQLASDFAAQLPEGREGLIVNLLDQRVWRLNPHFFSYTLTKSALWTATQTMAQAFAPRIRVNGVGPGPTLANHMQRAEDFRREAESIPLQRAITPDEIVAAVLFLLEARSVTGQMIAVDGGQHLAWKTPDVLD
jgi:NAD(P)-dependent dehydrogenase (short-subunit alcohol dehydrogenase family)